MALVMPEEGSAQMSGGEMRRVRRVSVVDEIVEQLTRRIIAGEWPPGSAMPSVRVLAAQLGVSTLTVGQAVRTLRERGLVETRHGSGTFVRSPDPADGTVGWMLSPTESTEYLELIEARKVIEGELLRLAAERGTADQIGELDEIVATMTESRLDAARFLEADLQFHISLAEAAHNRVLLRAMLAIRGPLKRLIANRTYWQLEETGNLDDSIADHRNIVAGLRRHEPTLGAAALGRITQRGERHLQLLREDESPYAEAAPDEAANEKKGGVS